MLRAAFGQTFAVVQLCPGQFHIGPFTGSHSQHQDPLNYVAPESSCDPSWINSILHSINVLSSVSNPGSMKSYNSFCRSSIQLRSCIAPQATVLLIDIQNFTAKCAELPAVRVGQWVAAFYKLVDAAAAAHGVRKVEVRGDCCICVAGAGDALPPAPRRRTPAAADSPGDQATRIRFPGASRRKKFYNRWWACSRNVVSVQISSLAQ